MQRETDSVERKVQLTGGSTYTVSLPKGWAGQQGIEPGTHVSLHSQGEQLIMTRGRDPDPEDRRVTIDALDHDATTLSLSIAAAYIAGCEEIKISNLTDREKRRGATRTIRRYVGLEVMTEDTDGLVARTMLDVADLSPAQTLAQIERTTLEMHAQALEALVEGDQQLGERIARQDDDVDRLFALVSRGFQQSLVDPAVTTDTDDTLSPFEYYMAARQLERVADHAEKIARLTERISGEPPEAVASDLLALGKRARGIVGRALAGLLESDVSALAGVVTDADDLLLDLSALDERLYERDPDDGYPLGLVVDSLVRTTQYGLNISEAGLQARHREVCSIRC